MTPLYSPCPPQHATIGAETVKGETVQSISTFWILPGLAHIVPGSLAGLSGMGFPASLVWTLSL